jgi:hypothetical protein
MVEATATRGPEPDENPAAGANATRPGVPTRGPDLAAVPHLLQILSTEHWSLLTARSLAYNEAFTRASMFLTFVSMSFVGLALLASATGFTSDFALIAVVVLGFDLVIALVTFMRVGQANLEDTLAMHGMNRIRAAYVRIAPEVDRFLVTGTTDDYPGVMKSYRITDLDQSMRGTVAYGLSTSLGLVGLVTSMLAGLLAGVLAITFGAGVVGAVIVGGVAGIVVLAALVSWGYRGAMRAIGTLDVRFPSVAGEDERA